MTQPELLISTAPGGVDVLDAAPRYSLLVAREGEEVVASQRLRHQVFAREMGATLRSTAPGLDVDRFDEFCDHLLVREDRTGQIVGSYRMLPPDRAREAGGYYAETEFDLSALDPIRSSLVETGRSCVHPDHRNGAVVGLVWAGIVRYVLLSGHTWLMGCASVPLADGGALAAGVWDLVRAKHHAPAEHHVRPHVPWDDSSTARPARTAVPPLLKGYLRLGAQVCGPPAHDPDFDVADLLILMRPALMDQRYLRHFLGETV
jgi:putative hemolysin